MISSCLNHIQITLRKNERICASAIYYYDNENIAPSYLDSRQASDIREAEQQRYEQGDTFWLEQVYEMDNFSAAVQEVGSVETREGRVITFPNVLQHRVESFKLKDPTKPGHRKILALILVDPHIKVISTAHVPCQQKEWRAEPMLKGDGPLERLPPELRDVVLDDVKDFPLTLDEAKKIREELIEERKIYDIMYKKNFDSVRISLCEH